MLNQNVLNIHLHLEINQLDREYYHGKREKGESREKRKQGTHGCGDRCLYFADVAARAVGASNCKRPFGNIVQFKKKQRVFKVDQ